MPQETKQQEEDTAAASSAKKPYSKLVGGTREKGVLYSVCPLSQ